jgi:hypothetical protein
MAQADGSGEPRPRFAGLGEFMSGPDGFQPILVRRLIGEFL